MNPDDSFPLLLQKMMEQLYTEFEAALKSGAAPRIENFLARLDRRVRDLPPEQFEAALKSGAAPRNEDNVAKLSERMRLKMLPELIECEIRHLLKRGQTCQKKDYKMRFPELPAEWSPQDFPTINGYKVLGILGKGGMGIVFEALELNLNREVALKTLLPDANPARFERESKITAKLPHPSIPPVYVMGTLANGSPFLAMKLIKGKTLAEEMKTADQPSLLQVFAQVCQAVGFAHSQNVIHRDLKPSNIMVGAFGEVQIMDWGLAKIRSDRKGADEPHAPEALTEPSLGTKANSANDPSPGTSTDDMMSAGAVMGTPAYMAPEQARCETVDARADVFSLGIILCEILTRQPQFNGKLALAENQQTTTEPQAELRPPSGVKPALKEIQKAAAAALVEAEKRLDKCNADKELVDLCRHCLKPDPKERPENGQVVADGLTAYLIGVQERLQAVERERAVALARAEEEVKTRKVAEEKAKFAEEKAKIAEEMAKIAKAKAKIAEEMAKIAKAKAAEERKRWYAQFALAATVVLAFAVIFSVYQRSETRQAEMRAESAEERQREQLRESLMQEVQNLQLTRLSNGWSVRAWDLICQAGDIQRDERLRDLAGTTLLGLDAKRVRRFPLPASSVAFDATGQRLLIGGHDAIRDTAARPALLAAGGETLSKLPGEGPVAFDAAGNPLQLVYDRVRHAIVLWDVAKNRTFREFPLGEAAGDQAPVLALSARATHVAASLGEQTLVWNAANGDIAARFAHRSEAIALSAQSDLVALADPGRRKLVVWSLDQKKAVAELHAGNLPTTSLAFGRTAHRPDTAQLPRFVERLASGDSGGNITIWDLESRIPTAFCLGSHREILTLAFSPDGALLASAGRLETQLWDVASGQPRLKLQDDNGMDYMTGLAFSPDGRRLAVSSKGSGVRAPSVVEWELAPQRGMQRLSGLSGQIDTVVISPDGRRLAALAVNWEVGLWDLETGHLMAVIEAPPGSFADNAGLAFSPDGGKLGISTSSTTAGEVRLLDANTGAERRRWKLPPGLQNKLAFDGPNRLWHFQVEIRSGALLPRKKVDWKEHPRVCRIRDLMSADPLKPVAEVADFNSHVYLAAAPQDGRHFAVEGLDGADGAQRWVKIIEAATGRITWSRDIPRHSNAGHLTLDPSGATLHFSPDEGPPSHRVSVPDGQPRGGWKLASVATTDDGALYCVTNFDNAQGCYLVRDGDARPILGLSRSAGPLGAAFNRAGDRFAWGERDGSIVVADLPKIRDRLAAIGLGW